MTDKTKEAPARSALKLALEAFDAKGDAWIVLERRAKAAIREALAEQPAIKQDLTPEQPDMNLNCKSVQARLAASWGYVKAEQPAPVAESRKPQQEPVAVVSGYYGGQCVILPTNPARLFNSGTALYTSPPAQPQQEPVAGWDSIEAMAEDRYKVIPSHDSMFYRHAVVAGNGAQQLYLGRELECENMARKFAGAFLDGAFVMQSRTSPTYEATPLASQSRSDDEQPAQQQEPVARVNDDGFIVETGLLISPGQLLYTSPASKPWVGLTDEETEVGLLRSDFAFMTAFAWRQGVEWAEAKLKEKNA